MKKLFSFLLSFILFVSYACAQNSGYTKGDKLLNIGIGVNSFYDSGIPFGASYEVGITDDISVGGNFDYLSSDFDSFGSSLKFTALYFAARGSYHVNNLLKIDNEKIDLYGGASLGYRVFSWKDDFNDSLDDKYGSGLFLGVHIGGKYYFNEKIGAFLELGDVGSSNARVGIAFKF